MWLQFWQDTGRSGKMPNLILLRHILTWNSLTNWANMNWCLSVLLGAVSTSGTVLWTWDFLWPAVPSKWQSKPTFPGNWKRWSWGPNGPMLSSGHTVLGPTRNTNMYMLLTSLPFLQLDFTATTYFTIKQFDLNPNTWLSMRYMGIRFIRTSSRKGSSSTNTESS